jgi:hypothetical protein
MGSDINAHTGGPDMDEITLVRAVLGTAAAPSTLAGDRLVPATPDRADRGI